MALTAATAWADTSGQVLLASTASAPAPAGVTASHHIESLTVAENRLVVSIANEGGAPIRGDLAISVNGERPTLVHGAAVPVAGTASISLDNVVVQRRASVTLDVRSADGRSAQTVSAVLAPDAPNDLELAAAHIDRDGVLTAEIRNNSPIPLTGNVIVAAREPAFPYTLLARIDATLDIQAGGAQQIRLGHVGSIDLTRTWIGLTTDAIEDANSGNDILNR